MMTWQPVTGPGYVLTGQIMEDFSYPLFKEAVKTYGKQLRYCGVGYHH